MAGELGEGLRDCGLKVEYVTAWWGSGGFRKRLGQRGFTTHVMRLGFISATFTLSAIRMTLHQLLHLPGLLIQYALFLKSVRPLRVIHTNWHHALLLLPMLKRNRDIYWSHEIIANKRRFRWLFGAIDKRVIGFVAVSEAVAAALREIGIAANRIRVIHNGLRDPAGSVVLAAGRTTTRIGIVGQVGSWKGHDDLLEAFAIVAASHAQVQLHIFGQGTQDYEEHLRRRAAQLGVTSKVIWHGFVPDQRVIYGSIDICAVPSRSEDPLPTSAIEASFFGLPVVASRRGGLPEIIDHDSTGLLFEAGNVKEMALHLETLVADSALANKMGRHARIRSTQKFGRDRFVDDFLNVLNDPEVVHANSW
jgi:glycosyltransferase involved in cell wall biosynthesis